MPRHALSIFFGSFPEDCPPGVRRAALCSPVELCCNAQRIRGWIRPAELQVAPMMGAAAQPWEGATLTGCVQGPPRPWAEPGERSAHATMWYAMSAAERRPWEAMTEQDAAAFVAELAAALESSEKMDVQICFLQHGLLPRARVRRLLPQKRTEVGIGTWDECKPRTLVQRPKTRYNSRSGQRCAPRAAVRGRHELFRALLALQTPSSAPCSGFSKPAVLRIWPNVEQDCSGAEFGTTNLEAPLARQCTRAHMSMTK